jgi:hypothetical protein
MSQSHLNRSNESAENDVTPNRKKVRRVNSDGSPDYHPAFNRVELTEIRAPFWGIVTNAMDQYFEERR